MKHTTVYVAGKSGGHIIPALTMLAAAAADKNARAVMITTATELDRKLVGAAPHVARHEALALRGRNSGIVGRVQLLLSLAGAFFKSIKILRREQPRKVISMGGLVSVPVCLAARLLRIPYELYELNVEPGRAVVFLASGAACVHLCFAATKKYFPQVTTQVTNYPLRFTPADKLVRIDACHALGIDPAKKIIVVFGGSQGSKFLNDIMLNLASANSAETLAAGKSPQFQERALGPAAGENNLYILHQTGNDVAAIQAHYQRAGISSLVASYVTEVNLWYCAADVIITRAGAGALNELIFFDKPALIIPLEVASTDHQLQNATVVAALQPHRWRVVRQHALATQPTLLADTLAALLNCQKTAQ